MRATFWPPKDTTRPVATDFDHHLHSSCGHPQRFHFRQTFVTSTAVTELHDIIRQSRDISTYHSPSLLLIFPLIHRVLSLIWEQRPLRSLLLQKMQVTTLAPGRSAKTSPHSANEVRCHAYLRSLEFRLFNSGCLLVDQTGSASLMHKYACQQDGSGRTCFQLSNSHRALPRLIQSD